MINPRLTMIDIDGTTYGYLWFDFGNFMRLDVYKNDKRIGMRRVPHIIDRTETVVAYFIKRLVGNHGDTKRTVRGKKEQSYYGNR